MQSDGGTDDRRSGEPADRARGLEHELAGALARGEISTLFQQQVDLADGTIVAAEALCRWQHPVLGAVSPDEFIPLAERTGAIHAIGAFMLGEAWALCRSHESVDVSVNLSPVQLSTAESRATLMRQIDGLDPSPGRITIEVTEAVEISNLSTVVGWLELLRERGLGVSVDDFGTGHSTFEQLMRLPATEVKLDRALVQSTETMTAAQVAGVLAVARARGLRVVAEGVETREQAERMRAAGCHRAQGFLYGVPVERDAFDALLSAQDQRRRS